MVVHVVQRLTENSRNCCVMFPHDNDDRSAEVGIKTYVLLEK